MSIIFEIAKRYLLGKKSTSAINFITWISILGITIGSAALILILSVFNGFESILSGLYNSFNPDLKITPIEGKYFEIEDDKWEELIQLKDIKYISKTVEEVALFEYKDSQKAGVIKGVDDQYTLVTSIDSTIRRGAFVTRERGVSRGVLGRTLSSNLTVNYSDAITPITVYMPLRKNSSFMSQMGKEYNTLSVYPSGVFSLGSEADTKYLITNFEAVNSLLSQENKISALELKLQPDSDEKALRKSILAIIGSDFDIKNRYQQDESFINVMNIEKWISFLITALMMIIIAFNLVGSLWMMVLEKKKDIAILRSMGFESSQIRKIFLTEGLIITGIGLVLGIVLALILYLLQKQYGLLSVPDGFMITAYPISLKLSDFVLVIATVLGIGWLASLLPAYRAGKVSAFVRREGGN